MTVAHAHVLSLTAIECETKTSGLLCSPVLLTMISASLSSNSPRDIPAETRSIRNVKSWDGR